MNSIGNCLKEARAKKAVTLEEVHSRIKIHPRVLLLLEEEKFDKLPSPMFVKSFLRSYAEFLEVNPEDIIQQYEKRGEKPPEQVLYIKPAAEKDRPPFLDKNTLNAVVAVALLAAVFVGGFFVIRAGMAWFSKEWSSWQKKDKPKGVKKTSSSGTQQPKSSRPAAPVESTGKSDEWLRSVAMDNFPKISKNTPLDLQIRALDNVWIKVTCDGKVLFQSILKKGASESWKANDQVEVWTGNSSSMSLTLNRYSLGSPGKGVIKRMVINREGVRIL
jgi:cytoskeletal protein RodZ